MVLESTIICVDNSEYMRNGDFIPTRLQAEQDAVNLICHAKHKSNAENNFGLLTFSEYKVLVTLTNEVGKILTAMHGIQPKGNINFLTGIRVAQLALKHRQTKNHKQRLVLFVGSPVENSEKELVAVAKRLKKENVSVDVISFGEETSNAEKLASFVSTVNGKGGSNSHLVTISSGPYLSEALRSSPVILGEEGGLAMGGGGGGGGFDGFQFGVDPNEDPELALALRVSLEEQRQRSEKEAKEEAKPMEEEAAAPAPAAAPEPAVAMEDEQETLQRALALSMEVGEPEPVAMETQRRLVTVEADGLDEEDEDEDEEEEDEMEMGEEEQLALAVEMSMQANDKEKYEDERNTKQEAEGEEVDDLGDVIDDPEFLRSVLSELPGVDTNSEEVRRAIENTKKRKEEKTPEKTPEKK